MTTRGFVRKRRSEPAGRVPPGQYLVNNFPVLSAGPTPRTPPSEWTFALVYNNQALASWSWEQLLALPRTQITVDIHCVTKWSKLDTVWEGVTIDDLLAAAQIQAVAAGQGGFAIDGSVQGNITTGASNDPTSQPRRARLCPFRQRRQGYRSGGQRAPSEFVQRRCQWATSK